MTAVVVVRHDPSWREAFETEAAILARVLGDNAVAIHHIGSTAIPGIYAKPVIDILVEFADVEALDALGPQMEQLGYEVMGEFGMPGRRYFRKDNDAGVRTHQIHAFPAGTEQVIRHLAFRDYMVAHPERANAYSELKRRLAAEYPDSMNDYMDGKDGFIKETDEMAALWPTQV
jgi:GrpB-like predicted nucleotidyltransferase (UPF0157 family)